jgi:sugar phosphate isomerase/epimerase
MIGLSCPPLCLRTLDEAAELVTEHFDLWEIMSEARHFLLEHRDELRELLETTDLKASLHAPFSDINLAAFDERTRRYSLEVLVETFEAASELGIEVVTIHPGSVVAIQRWAPERVVELTRKSLEELSVRAGEYSTTVALENMPEMSFAICKTADEMENMLDGLELDMCFDVGHANTTGQLEEMRRLRPLFRNLHLHDNHGHRDEHLTLGHGNIDFARVLAGLEGYAYDYVIESNSVESAVQSKAFLEGLL